MAYELVKFHFRDVLFPEINFCHNSDQREQMIANNVQNVDNPSEILNLGKIFIQGFLSLMNFLKARDKHPAIIFNVFGVILLLVTILKPRTVKGTSL